MARTSPATWRDVDGVIESSGDASAYSLGCTSTITPPSVDPAEWYVNAPLVPHEGLRYLLLVLERCVQPQYFQPVQPWKARRLFHFYRAITYLYIKEHHMAEDDAYFPWISTRAPLPSRFHSEHEGLVARMDAIAAMEGGLQSCQTDEARSQWAADLRRQVEELGEFMREHLTEEEALIIPALRDNFTEAEHAVILQQMAKALTPAGVPVAIAVSCAGQQRAGGEPLLDLFVAHLPPPLLDTWNAKWRPQIEAEMAYVNAICGGQKDEPPFDQSALFPIPTEAK